jgi:hypothetical protein
MPSSYPLTKKQQDYQTSQESWGQKGMVGAYVAAALEDRNPAGIGSGTHVPLASVNAAPKAAMPLRPSPVPGVSMPTDALTRARLGLNNPQTERTAMHGLGLAQIAPMMPSRPTTPPSVGTVVMPYSSFSAPVRPSGYNGAASSPNVAAQKAAVDAYANKAFNDWYGQHPDLSQFKPGKLTGVASPEAAGRFGKEYSATLEQGTGGMIRETLNNSRTDDEAQTRANAREHFIRNVLPLDEHHQALTAALTAAQTPASVPLHPGLVPSRVVESPKGTTTTYTPEKTDHSVEVANIRAQGQVDAANARKPGLLDNIGAGLKAIGQGIGKRIATPTKEEKPQPYGQTKEGFEAGLDVKREHNAQRIEESIQRSLDNMRKTLAFDGVTPEEMKPILEEHEKTIRGQYAKIGKRNEAGGTASVSPSNISDPRVASGPQATAPNSIPPSVGIGSQMLGSTVIRTGKHSDGRRVFQLQNGRTVDEQGKDVAP